MKSLRSVAPGAHSAGVPGYSFEMQELWFLLMRRPWASLAFVPAHEQGVSLSVARSLATIGGRFRGSPLMLLEGSDLELEDAARLSQTIQSLGGPRGAGEAPRSNTHGDQRTIVALDSVLKNPMGIPVALSADAVVLVIERLVTTRASAGRTLQALGRENVMGAVLVG